MAIVVRGKSVCSLCNRVIEKGDEIKSFSPIAGNELDPLFRFSDAAFHKQCFEHHPLADRARARDEAFQERTGPANRTCSGCGQPILHPDEYFTVGHLTDDSRDPLYRFNFVQLHKSCINNWRESAKLATLIEDLNSSGRWKGPTLDRLIHVLRMFLNE